MQHDSPASGAPQSRDDEEQDPLGALMRAAQDGDSAAYRQLLDDVARRLRGHVRRRAPWLGREDAEDLIQEVLISMHSARASYDPARPFMPWLAAIARNRIADHARRYGRRAEAMRGFSELAETFSGETANNSSEGVIMAMSLERVMEDLTPAQRDAVQMLRIEQLSLREASERSGTSVAALKVSVHRATKRLRARLSGKE